MRLAAPIAEAPEPASGPPASTAGVPIQADPDEEWEPWRWRYRAAESLARALDPERYGVVALYLIGSTKNATAGIGSDIDLLVHFRGTDEQRAALKIWLEGWSEALGRVNQLLTGLPASPLLDAKILDDDDLASRNSYAVKIGAIDDGARPLPLSD